MIPVLCFRSNLNRVTFSHRTLKILRPFSPPLEIVGWLRYSIPVAIEGCCFDFLGIGLEYCRCWPSGPIFPTVVIICWDRVTSAIAGYCSRFYIAGRRIGIVSISPWRPATIIIYFLICWARPITVLSYWCYVIRWARINICKAASFPVIVSIVCSCSVKIISIGIRNRAPNSMIGITGYRVASTTICPFVPRLVIQNSFLQRLSLRQILPPGTQDNVRWQHIIHALTFRVGRNQLLCSEHLRIHWLCGSLLWGLDISPIICPVRIFHYWRPSLLFRFIVLATSWSALCCI